MLDVRRMRLLRELALRGTIAAVAEALSFTPSAVSQQLSALEREAGVPLLERTGRRVRLTPAGQNLVRHAEAVLERLEQAASELAQARHGPAGPLRIGAFPTAARALLPTALARLAERHPRLEPMVSEVDPAGAVHALRAGVFDVALIHDHDSVPPERTPGLSAEPLCDESMYLVASDPAPAGQEGRAVLAHWRDAPWIAAAPGTTSRSMLERACQAAGFVPKVRHQVDEFATVLAFVAAGRGVAILPHLEVADAPPNVRVTPLPVRRRTKAAFRSGARSHPAVAALLAALRESVPLGLLPR